MKSKLSHIHLILFSIIGLLPFALAFGYTLLHSFGIIGVTNDGFTLEHWAAVFRSGEMISSFFYSGIIAIVSLVLSVGIAMLFVVKFHRLLERKWISYITFLPLALPGIVAAFFTLQVLSKSGFFSRIAYNLGLISGIEAFPDLVNDRYAIGIILVLVSIAMPFFVILFQNIYNREQLSSLRELALSIGATESQANRKVVIPILFQKSRVIIGLYFIFLFGVYEVPLILGQESPQMVSVLIVRELRQFDITKLSEGYAIASAYTVLIVAAVVLIFFTNRKVRI